MQISKKATISLIEYQTGLVLSGGGTRGFAHLGVLKALQENGIKPDIISAVSAGAIVGALYADGKSPEEILEIFTSHRLLHYLEFTIPKTGLMKMSGFENTINQHLTAKTFDDLKIPLKIFAVNLNTAEFVCFDRGALSTAVKASSSIPILFPPVKIGEHLYIDGGTINNFPIEPLLGRCKKIIGVSLNPLGSVKKINSIKHIAERTFQIAILNHAHERKDWCDIFIEPDGMDNYGFLKLSGAKKLFDIGYNACIKKLNETGW